MENFSADDAQRLVDIHLELLATRVEQLQGVLAACPLWQRRAVLAQIGDVKMEARHVRAHPKKIVFIRGA